MDDDILTSLKTEEKQLDHGCLLENTAREQETKDLLKFEFIKVEPYYPEPNSLPFPSICNEEAEVANQNDTSITSFSISNEMEPLNGTKKRKNTKHFFSDVTPDVIVNPTRNQDLLDDRPRKKRKRFSFEEKKNILEAINQYPPDVICEKYELSDRTLRKWKSEKEEIIQESKKTNSKKLKKKSTVEEMDDAMFQWLVEAQDQGIPISGPMIRRQALIVKENHPKNDQFKASEGWLTGFKKRTKIRSLKITDSRIQKMRIGILKKIRRH